ncbi:hypothetical protein [Aerosakkonema sp. BLCC-F183]|uniref:hypothetical protein n=1 Tax=Aerosakkonema sp. BLCC-F183 TaxID=3342834 RepID=UPI0035BC8870
MRSQWHASFRPSAKGRKGQRKVTQSFSFPLRTSALTFAYLCVEKTILNLNE